MIKKFNDLKYFAKGKNQEIDIKKAHEFLRAFKNKDDFLDYFKFEDLTCKFKIKFDKPMSENQFANLDFNHAKELFENLSKQNFSEFDAVNEKNWLYLNIELVKQETILPSSFVYASNRSSSGIENIKKALDCKDQEIIKDTLRIIARNMYGATLGGLRGKKGIYQEISLAMAWWRFYLAKEISQNTNLDLEQIYKYFITQKSNYNELIMRMSGGLTIISNPYTRDALISFLLSQEKITGNKFKEIIKKIGIQSAWRLIGGLDFKDNLQIIKEFAK